MDTPHEPMTPGQASYEAQDFSHIPAGFPKLVPWNRLGEVAKDYWNKVAQAAIAADPTRDELVRVLTICRDKFFEYAQIHRDKMTDEGQRKAVANRELGLMCKDALAAAGASCYDKGCPHYGTAHGHTEPGTVEGTLKALEILTAGNPPDFTEPTREKCTNPDCRIG